MKKHTICIITASLALAATSNAAISFTGTHSENFDSITSTGTAPPTDWLAGKLAGNTVGSKTLLIDDGSSTSKGNLFNYGTTGATDRALGSMATSGAYGVQVGLTNNTGIAITSLTIAYTGEQWRKFDDNGQGGIGYTLDISSTNGGTVTDLGSALDFFAPQNTGSSRQLDGNDAANRQSFDVTVDLTTIGYGAIAAGDDFFITWYDRNNSNNDNGVAVDDVTISVVPEPSSAALLGLGGLALILRRRK